MQKDILLKKLQEFQSNIKSQYQSFEQEINNIVNSISEEKSKGAIYNN